MLCKKQIKETNNTLLASELRELAYLDHIISAYAWQFSEKDDKILATKIKAIIKVENAYQESAE